MIWFTSTFQTAQEDARLSIAGKAGVGALGMVLLTLLLFLAVSSWTRNRSVAAASAQPINFPHNVHVQQYRIDCQYCHADARRSDYAGLPSVERCLGCHKIVAADRPEIKKLADYGARQVPIPWRRVFKVPEFTYFPHKPHVRAAVACQTCHGAVESMTTVGAHTGRTLANDMLNLAGFKPVAPVLTMGWCVECHRRQKATRGTHAPLDCVTCHH